MFLTVLFTFRFQFLHSYLICMNKRRIGVVIMIKRVVFVSTCLLLSLYTSGFFCEGPVVNFDGIKYGRLWDSMLETYGVPIGQFCITALYSIYIKFTLVNALVFSMKYLPTGLYLYTFVKSVYRSSRERLKLKQIELEDIVLQIAIVETKRSMREAECAEYSAQLRRESARLHAARASVRDLIAGEDSLRAVLERLDQESQHQQNAEDTDLKSRSIVELLKDLAHDKNGLIDNLKNLSEYDQRQFENISENSEYSTLSEAEEKDCHIKVIKVTNVYRMAYLKQYIKQKRLRRASKHILLKKKMESTKKMLESWQKSLNLALCSLEERDEISEEAMGDYSKRRESDTDSELRDSYDDYPVWDLPAPSGDYFQEPDSSESLDDLEFQEYNDKYYGKFYEDFESSTMREELQSDTEMPAPCECALQLMPRLIEETSSQMLAIQDTNKLGDGN